MVHPCEFPDALPTPCFSCIVAAAASPVERRDKPTIGAFAVDVVIDTVVVVRVGKGKGGGTKTMINYRKRNSKTLS